MQIPLELSFRGIEKSDSIEQLIREKVEKLEQVCSNMTSCRVAVEVPHKHQQHGRDYQVRINMRVPPGHELVAKNKAMGGNVHETLPAVLRQTFDAARKQLQELSEKQNRDVKAPPADEEIAIVVKLHDDEGFGFLRAPDGREFYFHRNSVLHDDFDRLAVGTGVRFSPEEGEKGPQASSVQIVDKPGVRRSEADAADPNRALG